jgi:hypothetical protein
LSDTALGMFIVAALFGLMLIVGLITQSMPLAPYLRFEREKDPLAYWAAAIFNGTMITIAVYIGVVTP